MPNNIIKMHLSGDIRTQTFPLTPFTSDSFTLTDFCSAAEFSQLNHQS